ncbi:MAG: hypothetical protein PF517_08605 [Salinivirgaceae bacterium]|jgi:hypothetical protein|nr:hypothetical protein [Salinivirgaceae bacterium]
MGITFESEFQNNLAGFHPTAEKIVITNAETVNNTFPISVLVKSIEDGNFIYHLPLKSELPGIFFRDSIIIENQLIIALENQLYFFNIDTKEIKPFRLNGYFDKFHFYDNKVLVCTNTYISCYSLDGIELWVSDKLAVEKIAVKSIDDEIINGIATLGDDNENKGFSILTPTGKSPNAKAIKKRVALFSFLFA